MGVVEFATSPWGQTVPIHISFALIWVCAIAGLLFLIGHAIWLRFFAPREEYQPTAPVEHSDRSYLMLAQITRGLVNCSFFGNGKDLDSGTDNIGHVHGGLLGQALTGC